jgi:hypothetical protein
MAGVTGEGYAIWTELDETSPLGSSEIHYSMSPTPFIPTSWTGRNKDIVLSQPDGEDGLPANAMAPSMSLANFGGIWKPQIAWSEKNAHGGGKSQQNNEVHYLPDTTFNIPIHLGWNLISVPLIQSNTSILEALDDSQGDGITNWSSVKYYSNTGTQVTWKSYNKAVPPEQCTLSDIDRKMGLWVYITTLGDGNLTVKGDYGTSTQITLKTGWNLVGYPAQTTKTVSASLAGTGYDKVEAYNSTSPYIKTLTGSDTMVPGQGYWVHVTSDATWTITW